MNCTTRNLSPRLYRIKRILNTQIYNVPSEMGSWEAPGGVSNLKPK